MLMVPAWNSYTISLNLVWSSSSDVPSAVGSSHVMEGMPVLDDQSPLSTNAIRQQTGQLELLVSTSMCLQVDKGKD